MGIPLRIQKSERMHYGKEGWIRAAGGTLTFKFLGILGPHFSTLMFTLWSFLGYLIYLHPIQGIEAEHSQSFKEENRSPVCGRVHSCGREWWWHALSYLRWVSSYNSVGNVALKVFSQTLIMEVSSSRPSPSGAPLTAPVPGLCSFPRGGKDCLVSACHRALVPIESTLLGLAFSSFQKKNKLIFIGV